MIIKKAYTSKEKSIYRCDICKKRLVSREDDIYLLWSKKVGERHNEGMWHLCEKDYYKIIKKKN